MDFGEALLSAQQTCVFTAVIERGSVYDVRTFSTHPHARDFDALGIVAWEVPA